MGRIDGEPWTDAIAFGQAGAVTRHLVTACFVVIAYLTGMRSTEVLALETGCCPDPGATEAHSSESRRHLVRARQFKTARDDDGNHLSAGEMREAPWIAVPQVVTAIRVLERLRPVRAAVPDRPRHPARPVAGVLHDGRGIEDLIDWVNERTARPGREDTIPADPHGHIGTSRFRRTLAWHIAPQPGGLIALAVQYGHLRTVVSQGYSSRQRDGIHELLDLETARAVAERLSEVHDALQHGEGVSGPAARRLIHAAREEHHRFGGMLATPRQAKALLSDPALTVFENADAYLTCNYDPRRALCNPDNAPDVTAGTPSLDRCQAACPNIARTETHALQLRAQAERLRGPADAALTPQPVADRLRHRATALDELADSTTAPASHSPTRNQRDHRPRTRPDPCRDRPAARRNAPALRRRAHRRVAGRRGRRQTARAHPPAHRPERRVLRPRPGARTRPCQQQELRGELKTTQAEAGRGPRGKPAAQGICRGVRPDRQCPHRRERPAHPAAKRAGQQDPDSAPTGRQLKRNRCEQTSFVSNEPPLRPPSCP